MRKSKQATLGILGFVGIIILGLVLYLGISRASGWWSCFGNQVELGRKTEFSFFFNSCVIDSGRVDTRGNVIWVRAENDRGF